MIRFYSPFKREREFSEIAEMKAQSRMFMRLYLRLFVAIVIIAGCVLIYGAGLVKGELSACTVSRRN